MTLEEKQAQRLEEENKRNRIIEFNKRRTWLYQFLAGYKQNSGIFINNFFRNRSYQMYCEDIFHGFDFDVSGIMPNVFDDMAFSISMVEYLGKLEDKKIAYFPIDIGYIQHLVAFAECLDLMEPLEEDLIVYRGCSTIERNGVNGIVSTTTDKIVAEQFSRGTILTIHVPKGTKVMDVKAIRPKEQQKGDKEKEILLPPCSYEILSEQEVRKGREPNNWRSTTKLLTISVQPLDLLEEFLKMLENPPVEYQQIREVQGEMYDRIIAMLKRYIEKRDNGELSYALDGKKKIKES